MAGQPGSPTFRFTTHHHVGNEWQRALESGASEAEYAVKKDEGDEAEPDEKPYKAKSHSKRATLTWQPVRDDNASLQSYL